MESSKKEGGIVQLVVVLGLITFVCALLLGFINSVTSSRIAQNNENTRNEAMAAILPAAENFETVDVSTDWTAPADKSQPPISGVYEAQAGGQTIGYCVEVNPSGFGGTMTMIVGINMDGTVAGAQVTAHSETPGLGAKAQSDPGWIGQYAGQPADGSLAVSKDGGTIEAITGSTITSRAVTLGVNTAARCVASLG
nr:RnfABCDGE type electron transport complex subunit G [uncultured Agathobaculum sp.]